METKPILTIAIPTYNGERTIKFLLDILLPQCTNEIELFISNNCSIDSTAEIIEEYKLKYPFIKNVYNEKNIGPDGNFLQCMKMANGIFTWLVSDDDVVLENSVSKVLSFLRSNKDVGVVYATTIDFRGKYEGIDKCTFHEPLVENDICISDKVEFVKYAFNYWGFISSFICKTDNFNKISNPEQFYGTYWLQSYIHALCAIGDNTQLGIIKGPCVGAGIYVNTPAFDSANINGVYYKKLLDFMVKEVRFDKNQLEKLFKWRICHLSRHDILKEKSAAMSNLNKKTLFKCTKKYLQAWLTVYPLFLVPNFMCKTAMKWYRRKLSMKDEIRINRPE